VAVAFQVVLIVGQADVAIPQNLSGAVNYSCARCVTYALAQQLVLTVPGDLDADQHRRLDALWQQISAFAASVQHVPLDQVRNRLLAFQDQVRELVKEMGTPAPATSSTAPPTGPGTATVTPGAPRRSPSPTESLTPPPTPTGTLPDSSAAPTTATAGPTSEPSTEQSTSASATESSAPEPSPSATAAESSAPEASSDPSATP
jgi:putative peptide zinc metalloprotease protein